MEDLIIINETIESPFIKMDFKNGILEFKGNSTIDDVVLFYKPVLVWLDNYSNYTKKDLRVLFKFQYLNVHSETILFDILTKFYQIKDKNYVEIYWVCKDENDEELGMRFKEYFNDIIFIYE